MAFKKWNIAKSSDFALLMQKYSLCSLSAKTLAARKNSLSETEIFSDKDSIYSPFDLKDMDIAADVAAQMF